MKNKVKVLNYRVIVESDERVGTGEPCFMAYCPKLDITDDGNTIDEALANIKEAIELYVETLTEEGAKLPLEKTDVMYTSVSIPMSSNATSRGYNFA